MKTFTQREAIKIRNARICSTGKPYIVDRIAHGKWIVRPMPPPWGGAEERARQMRSDARRKARRT